MPAGVFGREMTMKVFVIFLVLSPIYSHSLFYPELPDDVMIGDLEKAPPNDEQRLLRHIMRTYDKSVRPVYSAQLVVTVAIGMTLTHIFNVDEKKQVLSMNVWLEQEWNDQRISWATGDFGNITTLTVPTRYLWTPDIVLYNNAQDFSHGIAQTNVNIEGNGNVLWAPPVKFHSTCKLDVSYFPFDDQICALRFGSWIYDGRQVDVTNRSDKITIDADSFIENGEWQIVDTKVERHVNKYPCCPNTTFPDLTFVLHLRRRTLYYLYNIIIPCIMLSILTLMQFWLPCESGEKVTLGLTVLLAYSVFSFNIAENMPETSEVIPLIAIYLMCIMGISAASVTLSVIVLNMRHGGERKRAVPVWLQYFAYNILGRIICWEGDNSKVIEARRTASELSFNKAFGSFNTTPYAQPAHAQSSPAIHHSASGLPNTPISDNRNHVPSPQQIHQSQPAPTAPNEIFRQYKQAGQSAFWRDAPSPMIELTHIPPPGPNTPASDHHLGMVHSTSVGPPLVNGPPRPRNNQIGNSASTQTFVKKRNRDKYGQQSPDDPRRDQLQKDVMARAAKLIDRLEGEKSSEDLLHEWRKVSRIFDQFFFGLIFSLTTFVTVAMLILAPRFSSHSALIHQFRG